MWDEPFDSSLIGKVDMVIMCHTLKDTIFDVPGDPADFLLI